MNTENEIYYFNILKKQVISHFREDFSYVPEDPTQWKIMHINYFQEHLFHRIKGNFSDRWFYTYFKNEADKAPRIDMLNILAQYAGYQNWGEFVEKTPSPEQIPSSNGSILTDEKKERNTGPPIMRKKPIQWVISVGALLLLMAGALYWHDARSNTYQFYFKDNDRGSMMQGIKVYIPANTQETRMLSDEEGKVEIFSREDSIKMFIESPFYHKDTFRINLALSDGVEIIDLSPNEYALMMYYYSHSDNTQVDKRRKELGQLIADNALIYQVYDNENYGQEVLSKEQYINMMTAPTQSLKNFVLINSEESKGKITHIKFKIIPNEQQ